jgi:hypothetical protein
MSGLRKLRDKDFCRPDHRLSYRQRLHTGPHGVAATEQLPTGMASFAARWPDVAGSVQRSLNCWAAPGPYPTCLPQLLPIAVFEAEVKVEAQGAGSPKPPAAEIAATSACVPSPSKDRQRSLAAGLEAFLTLPHVKSALAASEARLQSVGPGRQQEQSGAEETGTPNRAVEPETPMVWPPMAGVAAGPPANCVELPLAAMRLAERVPLAWSAEMQALPLPARVKPAVSRSGNRRLDPVPSTPKRPESVVWLRPITASALTSPHLIGRPARKVPEAGFTPWKYRAERRRTEPRLRLVWEGLNPVPEPVRFRIVAVLDSIDVEATIPEPAPKEPVSEEPAPQKGVTTLEARTRPGPMVGLVGKVIAAGLVIGVICLGARLARFSRHNATARQTTVRESTVPPVAPPVSADARSAGSSSTGKSEGSLGWARKAIASRASFQAGDNFQNGMQAWGAGPGSYTPNWKRSREGYVRPGDLALFSPTLKRTDYSLEFSGQADKKGLGWVVRAQDPQNYYAMKVKVLEGGLRPVISVVHYRVIGGSAGQQVETPLNVMMHKDEAIQVTVTVKGNRFSTFIQGEEVDSWSDDALPSGGVGFFADAGSSARLYWMKVTSNNDWLGRVCSMLAGSDGDTGTTAFFRERAPATGRAWPPG